MFRNEKKNSQRGATLVEFAIAGVVFFTAIFAIIELGRLLWIHNTLKYASQRGARYAVTRKNDSTSIAAVKNVVVYGSPNPAIGDKPVVDGLTTAKVTVDYANFNGLQLSSRATVTISGYVFNFAVPLVGTSLALPAYRTALPGESAGFVPCDIPTTTPQAPCNIVPN